MPSEDATAISTIVNSKAAEKLSEAACGLVYLRHKIVELTAGPKRIENVEAAKSRAALQRAKTDAEIQRIFVDTGNYVLVHEMRKTVNREAIVEEAYKALPPIDAPVSDTPVSQDFLFNVFDKFDSISDPQVHTIVGRLIAGEIVKPGSFSRRTIRILHDLESVDFEKFAQLCQFTWLIAGNSVPLVFDPAKTFYKDAGLSFQLIRELECLGLITHQSVGDYTLTMNSIGYFSLTYNTRSMTAKVPDNKTVNVGKVMFTQAGLQLYPLVTRNLVEGFEEYVVEHYKSKGIEIEGSKNSP